MESPEKTAARARAKRKRLALRVGIVAVVALAAGGVAWAIRSDDGGTVETGTPGFTDEERTIDTSPFELAGPGATAPTTIPGDFGQGAGPTVPTTTTEPPPPYVPPPLPDVPLDDVLCVLTRAVLEGVRIVEGPGGPSPDNLEAASQRFEQAAALALDSDSPDAGTVALLAQQISIDLLGARTADEAKAIYSRLTSPDDPQIQRLLAEFGPHLRETCPGLIPA